MNFNNVLKSKYVYYAAVALMAINVLGYVSLGSIECVLVLGGAAYLANHFTKNRTADIFIGLFVSNILFGCGRLREGMDHMDAGKLTKKAQAAADQTKKEKTADAACTPDMEKKGLCLNQAKAADTASKHLAAAGDAIDAATETA
jgi:hypothetical protein